MDLRRWTFRAFLALAAAGLVAGCASRDAGESVGDGNETGANGTIDTGMTGCTPEGQTGSGTGDITADNACPPAGNETGDGNMTGPSLP